MLRYVIVKATRENRMEVNYEMIISLVIVMATIVGTTVPLYIHSSSQITALHQAVTAQISAIHQKMKDFHGRMCAIEENKKK